jgi:hypothetical protein
VKKPSKLPAGTLEIRNDHGHRVVVVRDLAFLGWAMKLAQKGV